MRVVPIARRVLPFARLVNADLPRHHRADAEHTSTRGSTLGKSIAEGGERKFGKIATSTFAPLRIHET